MELDVRLRATIWISLAIVVSDGPEDCVMKM